MKTKLFTIAFLAVVGFSQAAVTYQFSVTGTNRATGFANNPGVATDGMRYGILFDTSGNGFGSFTSNGTAPAASPYAVFTNTSSQFLDSFAGGVTDDYYWVPGNATPLTTTLSATGSDTGGAGGITTATLMPVGTDSGLPAGLNSGDKFAIIWFDGTPSSTSYYGLFTDASFAVPASGITPVPFNTPFLGSGDALKSANLSFAAVPEPSRMILIGLGLIGVFFRRRR